MTTQKQLVLASKSPRRKELLEQIGLKFIIHPSDFEEKDEHLSAEELAMHNAMGKAQQLARKYKNALIIGVDTVVSFQHHQINKPKDEEDAKRILRLLSNTTHQVISAICIIDTDNGKNISGLEVTNVTMDRLDEKDIAAYIASGEGEDKAGAYAIQGLGALYVKKIEGDYFNVVGLPIFLLRKLLKKFSYKLLPSNR